MAIKPERNWNYNRKCSNNFLATVVEEHNQKRLNWPLGKILKIFFLIVTAKKRAIFKACFIANKIFKTFANIFILLYFIYLFIYFYFSLLLCCKSIRYCLLLLLLLLLFLINVAFLTKLDTGSITMRCQTTLLNIIDNVGAKTILWFPMQINMLFTCVFIRLLYLWSRLST